MSEAHTETALARSEPAGLSRRAQLSKAALQEEIDQRNLLGQYVKACMVEGTDFGKIPGTDKPTLLKPGAEKLIALFHCEPRFDLVPGFCETDFDKGFFKYTFKCLIVAPGGAVLAEGYGSANSLEGRYRWRDGKRRCPDCGHPEALLKSKKEPGFFCWEKKGGCGANFKPDDKRITEQQVGKVENPDIADIDNTILKMAKKRAQVDGAIALARCSDMFTQDVEDFAGHHGGQPPSEDPSSSPPPEPEPPAQEQKPKAKQEKKPAALLTLEEAQRKDRTKELVGFKQWKSRTIAGLDDTELGEAWDAGQALEQELSAPDHPQRWTLNAVKNRVMLLALEYEARETKAGTVPKDLVAP